MTASLAFSAGILFSRVVSHSVWMWIVAAVLVGALAQPCSRTPNRASPTALVSIALLGSFASAAREAATNSDLSLLRHTTGSEVVLTAHVIRDGIWRESPYGGRDQSLDLEIDEVWMAVLFGLRGLFAELLD